MGNRTTFSYSDDLTLAAITDPRGNTFRFEYNANGNRTAFIMPDNTAIRAEFDARGRIISQTDQNNNITRYGYDNADRLIYVTDAIGNTWHYTYGTMGELLTVTDPNGNRTSYYYDTMGRVIRIRNALDDEATNEYDDLGRLTRATDFANNSTLFTYDSAGRIIRRETGSIVYTFTYTANDLIEIVTDSRGITRFTYDNMDGLVSVIDPDGLEIRYSYDLAGRLTKISTDFSETIYTYDLLDRLTAVMDMNGGITRFGYDASGNRTAVHLPNGTTQLYTFDTLNRLTEVRTINDKGATIALYRYTIGNMGEWLTVNENGRIVNYEYDELLRLTKETTIENNYTVTVTFTYDAVGNRLTKNENGNITRYEYNELNQLLTERGTRNIDYTYDRNGNMISQISTDGETTIFTFNEEGLLLRATVQNTQGITTESYTYDAFRNRITKTNDDETVRFLIDTNNWISHVLAEINPTDSNLITQYVRAGDRLVSLIREDYTRYYAFDGHGTVRLLLDENSNVTDSYTFDAFGNLINRTGTTQNDFLYTGEQFNSVTGLYYLRARYMNPSIGRFISQDPFWNVDNMIFGDGSAGLFGERTPDIQAIMQSGNLYGYALNNPVMFIDPTGEFSIKAINTLTVVMILANAINSATSYGYGWGDPQMYIYIYF